MGLGQDQSRVSSEGYYTVSGGIWQLGVTKKPSWKPVLSTKGELPGRFDPLITGKSYGDVDVAIVMDHLILSAASLGLGTCWIGAFDPDAAREVLALPDGVEPVAFTPLGYPADQPRPKKQKAVSELVRYERW